MTLFLAVRVYVDVIQLRVNTIEWQCVRSIQLICFDLSQALWKLNVLDIENTVKAVVDRVLEDKYVTRDVALKRAKALKRAGKIFQVGSCDAAAKMRKLIW